MSRDRVGMKRGKARHTSIQSSPSLCSSDIPLRLLCFQAQFLYFCVSFSETAITPTLSRSARTTRQPLPLLSPDPTTHTARNRTRLRSFLAQTSNLQPAVITESIIRTRTHATTTIAVARRGGRGCDGLDTDHVPCRSTGAGLAGPFPRAEDIRRVDGLGDVIRTHEYY
jgi:hypothetical protein